MCTNRVTLELSLSLVIAALVITALSHHLALLTRGPTLCSSATAIRKVGSAFKETRRPMCAVAVAWPIAVVAFFSIGYLLEAPALASSLAPLQIACLVLAVLSASLIWPVNWRWALLKRNASLSLGELFFAYFEEAVDWSPHDGCDDAKPNPARGAGLVVSSLGSAFFITCVTIVATVLRSPTLPSLLPRATPSTGVAAEPTLLPVLLPLLEASAWILFSVCGSSSVSVSLFLLVHANALLPPAARGVPPADMEAGVEDEAATGSWMLGCAYMLLGGLLGARALLDAFRAQSFSRGGALRAWMRDPAANGLTSVALRNDMSSLSCVLAAWLLLYVYLRLVPAQEMRWLLSMGTDDAGAPPSTLSQPESSHPSVVLFAVALPLLVVLNVLTGAAPWAFAMAAIEFGV